MASAAALDSSVFSKVNTSEAVPATWEERASKAWEYYLEEPLVKNCINSWRNFAVSETGNSSCGSFQIHFGLMGTSGHSCSAGC